jgi:polyisoprenoid-binding protein YceI
VLRGSRHRAACWVALALALWPLAVAWAGAAVAPTAEPVAVARDAPAAAPTTTRWIIDSARSQAQFRIRLLGIVPMSGEFAQLRGEIAFDAVRGDARVDAWLPSGEVRMANPAHAEWARSAEFFDAARHPTINFRSLPLPQSVLRDGGAIEGALTLRGVTREVGLKVERGGCDPALQRECTIEVYGQVRRTDFGMAARRGTVGDWVSLRLRIVAVAGEGVGP